ncbi:MAG: hypothetical protein MUF36_03745 [Bacteroidales bacterium]|jgi:hypothetical protein|nr:hypothetical protein [Bacteroidales bacterium]
MEKLFFNLSEEEFSKGRKLLLWIVTAFFIIGGIYVALLSPVFGKHSIRPLISLAPFGIGFIIGSTALYASIQRKDLFFLIDDDKIEFRYGIFRPKKYSFPWTDIKKLVMPHKERKVKVMFKDGTSYIIDISYIQRKKSTIIRKHLFHAARAQNIDVLKVVSLAHHKKHNVSHSS